MSLLGSPTAAALACGLALAGCGSGATQAAETPGKGRVKGGLRSWSDLVPRAEGARECYVATGGRPENAGTRESPWDLGSVLAGRQKLSGGDVVWVRGGKYEHPKRSFEVKLAGEETRPVIVRAAEGERVTVNSSLQIIAPADYLWLWGMEVVVAEAVGRERRIEARGSHPNDPEIAHLYEGVGIHSGKGCKYVNMVVHDTRQGFSFWRGAVDSEIHGCIIHDNGWVAPDRPHGPAIYTQNRAPGRKWITDNLIAANHGSALQAYGSKRAYVENYTVEGNVWFEPRPDGRLRALVGGGRGGESGHVVRGNVLYRHSLQVGYGGKKNRDALVEGNVVVGSKLGIRNYEKATERNNLRLAEAGGEVRIFLRANKYDPNRANLAVVNGPKTPTVDVPLGGFLEVGDRFRIQKAADFFGKPVLEGVYEGGAVAVPMVELRWTPRHEFGAFVVLRE